MTTHHPWGVRALSAGLFTGLVLLGFEYAGAWSTDRPRGQAAAEKLTPDTIAEPRTPSTTAEQQPSDTPTVPPVTVSEVVGFSGGCEPFRVIAQNRWKPYGTAVRAGLTVSATKIGSFAPNEPIYVDGWARGDVAYQYNSSPWNSNIWFHLADDSGWVSFAGVRELPTTPDPSSLDAYGGPPAPTPKTCRGAAQ